VGAHPHRQLYDVLADERLDQAAKDREVQRLVDYYKTRPDVAFSSKPKSMKLMQEQPYSLAFRQQYPKFNGLIWAYHWLQVGLYEPLVVGTTVAQRQGGVRATVARFWQMLGDPPRSFPHQMPMTPAVAPRFAARYPRGGDRLRQPALDARRHQRHPRQRRVPRARSAPRSCAAAARFRDDTSYVMSREAWLAMSGHMGRREHGRPVRRLPADAADADRDVRRGDVARRPHRRDGRLLVRPGGGQRARGARRAGGGTGAGVPAAAPAADPHAGHAAPAATAPSPAAAPARAAAPAAARPARRPAAKPRARPAPKPKPPAKPADPHAGHRP
jgi:hypothetical protein